MKKKFSIIIVFATLVSFCSGAASMYFFIINRAYMRHGIFIDRTHDMEKFGISTGKDYSDDNPYNYVPVDWLAKEVEFKTLIETFKDNNRPDIDLVIKLAKSGKYKIYFFSSPIAMWYSLAGSEGYCIVDTSLGSVRKWIILTGAIRGSTPKPAEFVQYEGATELITRLRHLTMLQRDKLHGRNHWKMNTNIVAQICCE